MLRQNHAIRSLIITVVASLALSGCMQATNGNATDIPVLDTFPATDGLRLPCPAPCAMALHLEDAARASFWIFWNDTMALGPEATLQLPDGQMIDLVPGYRASMILLDDPMNGLYTIRSNASVEIGVDVVELQDGLHDILPNMVNLIPSDINRRTPTFELQGESLPVGDGCAAAEIAEDRPMRCLRLSNAVGNAGLGNLEVQLPYEEGAVGFTGDGRFRQIVDQSDGSQRTELVGMATFHRIHGHWHYGGLQDFRLYSFDVDTMTRGPEATLGHKAGFCLEDRDHIDGYAGPFGEAKYGAASCQQGDAAGQHWFFGVSPGFYDLYWSELSGQYVEISNVPDGTYELVATSIASGILEETPWDNIASVVIDLQGDQVEVLHEFGWYRVAA